MDETTDQTTNETTRGLERILKRQVGQRNIFNAAIGVERGDGSLAWSGGAGLARPEDDAPMRSDSPYHVASVTKIYTAAAVMLLAESGSLDLHDPVGGFVAPGVLDGLHLFRGTNYADRLQVHHLLGHTSGLADYFEEKDRRGRTFVQTLAVEGDRAWTHEQLLELVRTDLTPKFPPAPSEGAGHEAHYSDTNYQLLGSVVEEVTGSTFGEALHDLLFEPFGLSDTYVFGDDPAGREREAPATIYRRNEPFVIPEAMKAFGPNGGIVSTVDEQIAFLRAMFSGRMFRRPETLERMQGWNKLFFPVTYGYGLMKYDLPRWMSPFQTVPTFIGHSGSIGSFAFYSPDRDLYLAGTVNQVEARALPFRLMPRLAAAVT